MLTLSHPCLFALNLQVTKSANNYSSFSSNWSSNTELQLLEKNSTEADSLRTGTTFSKFSIIEFFILGFYDSSMYTKLPFFWLFQTYSLCLIISYSPIKTQSTF